MPLERREVYYRGRVQGVGFRYTTRQIAAGFDVGGFVQNLPDGSVLLVVEGEAAELEALLAAIANQMGPYIHDVQVTMHAPRGEFESFEIRR